MPNAPSRLPIAAMGLLLLVLLPVWPALALIVWVTGTNPIEFAFLYARAIRDCFILTVRA